MLPAKNLNELMSTLRAVEILGSPDRLITGLCYDSRRVEEGNVFFALPGAKHDGRRFVFSAIEHGAVAVVSEAFAGGVSPSICQVRVRDARQALALAAAAFYHHPTRSLCLVGITGTNGKTTTAYLTHSIFEAMQEGAGLFGTIEYRIAKRSIVAKNTTPESLDLQRFFAELREAGYRRAVMEVSSHSLEMHRVDGCEFTVGVFTNLTRDHLDFHKTMDGYFEAKRKLFLGAESPPPAWAVLNVDDERGARLCAELSNQKISYGMGESAQVHSGPVDYSLDGLKMTVETPRGALLVESALVGQPNVYNILAAVATATALDIDMEAIRQGIRTLRSIPGRFEKVNCGQPFAVVVDYAHTDDALRNVITAARRLTRRRVITVFGCGGDRDRTKRPLMGEVAGKLSDFTVLTSDNPRTEDPLLIIADAVVGLQRESHRYVVEPDRAKAIRCAIEEAREGDIVLLTGKGHETYQVVGDQNIHFDDREVAQEVLTQLGYKSSVCN
jgi:UDP-N-acetylmuramoyl-L-alanyl-D-glutamate--2,6-diaminopimelate ligase